MQSMKTATRFAVRKYIANTELFQKIFLKYFLVNFTFFF